MIFKGYFPLQIDCLLSGWISTNLRLEERVFWLICWLTCWYEWMTNKGIGFQFSVKDFDCVERNLTIIKIILTFLYKLNTHFSFK